MQSLPFNRLVKVGWWMAGLVAIGTLGYIILEDWSLADSFFMTVITISTVGYGEIHTLSRDGRMFTSGLIFVSLISMTGWTAVLTSFIVECDLGGHFEHRRTSRMISELKNHTVVCGTGQMAQAVIDRLLRKRVHVVVVDSDPDQLAQLKKRSRRLLVIEGSASDEVNLARANVLEAAYVVAATDSELDNLLIGITCKDIGDNVKVIARCNNPAIANRMRKAGIDEVISPSQLGGERASELISV